MGCISSKARERRKILDETNIPSNKLILFRRHSQIPTQKEIFLWKKYCLNYEKCQESMELTLLSQTCDGEFLMKIHFITKHGWVVSENSRGVGVNLVEFFSFPWSVIFSVDLFHVSFTVLRSDMYSLRTLYSTPLPLHILIYPNLNFHKTLSLLTLNPD